MGMMLVTKAERTEEGPLPSFHFPYYFFFHLQLPSFPLGRNGAGHKVSAPDHEIIIKS